MYAGALGDTEDRYTHKVLNEKKRLQQVLSQNRTPAPAPVRTASAAARIQRVPPAARLSGLSRRAPMARIRIAWNGGEVIANLRGTSSVNQLVTVLPCEARANTWGEEVYFELPLKLTLEADARQVVEPGTVCFWVEGSALALPFGPTPASKGRRTLPRHPLQRAGKDRGRPARVEEGEGGRGDPRRTFADKA